MKKQSQPIMIDAAAKVPTTIDTENTGRIAFDSVAFLEYNEYLVATWWR